MICAKIQFIEQNENFKMRRTKSMQLRFLTSWQYIPGRTSSFMPSCSQSVYIHIICLLACLSDPWMFRYNFSQWDRQQKKWSVRTFPHNFAKSARLWLQFCQGFDYCNRRKIPTWRRCNKSVDIRICNKPIRIWNTNSYKLWFWFRCRLVKISLCHNNVSCRTL